MPVLEDRVSRLEEAVARFVEQSSMAIAAIHEDVAEIRASNARTDRELLRLRQDSEKRWEEAKQQADQAPAESKLSREESRREWEEWKKEAAEERRAFNKQMAEISDGQGRLIEDILHPIAPRIAAQLFGDDPIETLAIRVKRRHPADASRVLGIDLMVAGKKHLLIGEEKSTFAVGKSDAFLAKLATVAEFFPEYAGHTLLPLLASVAFDPSLLAYLSRQRIYALGLGDETMELLNEGAF